MSTGKLLAVTVVVWIWWMVFDLLLANPLVGSAFAQIPGMRETAMQWVAIGNLAGALVFTWVFARVRGSFGPGAKGGASYGLHAGVLISFPGYLWMTVYNTWPYGAVWHITLVFIVIYTLTGALVGLVDEKMGGPTAA